MPLTTRLKIDLSFGAALLLLVGVALVSFRSVRELGTSQDWVVHTEQVLREIEATESSVKEAETAQRGFLLTGQDGYLEPYRRAAASAERELDVLRGLLADNPGQLERLETLDSLVDSRLALLEGTLQLARAAGLDESQVTVRLGEGQRVMDAVRAAADGLRTEEFSLLQERRAREAATARGTILLVVLGSGLAIAIGAVSRQSLVRQLRAREKAETALAKNDRFLRELHDITSSTELDHDQKLNALLAMGVRRFGLSIGVVARVQGERYELLAVRDASGTLNAGTVLPLSDTYCAHVLRGRGPVTLADVSRTEWRDRRCYEVFGLDAYVGVPILVEGEAYGVLTFSDPKPRETDFTPGEQDFLRLMGEWVGHELERHASAEERREREERYRVLVESAGDLIFTTDREGRFTYVNPSAVRATGYSAEELLGMDSMELVRPDRRQEAHEAFVEQAKSRTRAVYHELPVITKHGSEIWLGQNVQLLTSGDRVTGRQAVARDITRQLEVERMKDEFLSVVSHELRTPLTAIRGSLGLLAGGRMGTLEERGQRMLEIAAQNTDRLVRLINDLLDIEKIESGKAAMEKEEVDLARLVEGAVEAMQPLGEKAGVRLECATVGATLFADPDRILQVLTNLISNAVKFSTEGGVVRVSGEVVDGEVRVSVSDTGRGIPTDKLEAIFDRFQQVDSSDARQKGGTGLGLPIARSIVQQHGGRIWVESQWGEGSTFHFSLPLHAPSRDHAEPLILVCDDDPGVTAYVREVLQRAGYRVVTASGGEDAVRLAVAQRPAVVLLDVAFPGTSGRAVLAALRARPESASVPVVMVTATEERDAGIDPADVVGWIEKPIDREALLRTVQWAANRVEERCNVLLVEDDPDLARVVTEMLRAHGVTTCTARDGAEAIEMSRRLSFDLLVLDPGLPRVDGFEVVDWLRRHNRHRNVPVVVYTARELDDSERERLRLGPTEFLVKARAPLEQLEARVSALFRRGRAPETQES